MQRVEISKSVVWSMYGCVCMCMVERTKDNSSLSHVAGSVESSSERERDCRLRQPFEGESTPGPGVAHPTNDPPSCKAEGENSSSKQKEREEGSSHPPP